MSVTAPADSDEVQVKIKSSDKQTKEKDNDDGDEQIEGMSVSDIPQFTDSAILEIKEIRTIRYSRDELFHLLKSPFSKKKPEFLDINLASAILDSQAWPGDRRKSETNIENGPKSGDAAESRRRQGDPRERIRKENDGIVLSPQRRSFTLGCSVPPREPRTNRPHSPLGKNESAPHIAVREIPSSTRRIGSGRIIREGWDFNDKNDSGDVYNNRSQSRTFDRDEKYNDGRRSFGRDFDVGGRDKDKEKDNRRNSSHFNSRRRMNSERDEEPEWFSGGPISQNDTIELRGFEDDKIKKKITPSKVTKRGNLKEIRRKGDTKTVEEENEEESPVDRSTPTPQDGNSQEDSQQQQKKEVKPAETENKSNSKTDEKGSNADQSFNFDEILKCDTFGLLPNGFDGEADTTKSRFTAWFNNRKSPEKQHESRRSSLQDDQMIKNLLNITETNVSIPGSTDSYFAPISPAANTGIAMGKNVGHSMSQSIDIMEMMQRGKHQEHHEPKQAPMMGKFLSLDVLEANMRKTMEMGGANQKQHKNDDGMAAFKKFLAQANVDNGPKMQQPMSILEMLNHSQQQDEARAQMMGNNPNINAMPDISIKLQQVHQQQQHQKQMEMLNKLINANVNIQPPPLRASPLHDLGLQQSKDLLNRPEAKAILQGMKKGEITVQHLSQQLANPALQSRHKEMLMAILKYNSSIGGVGPGSRGLSPVPPAHHLYQQQQQLRVSPLPPNAMHQRIPSPRELQVHTQSILQRALIKKKLEEQQENYRKKQEMQQRGQSPNTNNNNSNNPKSVSSPTFAFTPTSVLRKMTAEKDDGKENKMIGDGGKNPQGRPVTGVKPQAPQQLQSPSQPQPQWNQQFPIKQPAGRPIVKANANFPAGGSGQTVADQFIFQQQQQQQRLLVAQQQQQQQQRKASLSINPNQPNNNQFHNSMQGVPPQIHNQFFSSNQQFPPHQQQLTQQQLRAQHQQHARPANQPPQQQQPPSSQQSHLPPQQHPQHLTGNYQSNQQQQQQMGQTWQLFNSSQQGRGVGLNDGDLSPTTTNQLNCWFSSALEKARVGGQLPSTAGLGQHALSLEEIERQTAPPVHN